ncbi:protein kinase domain-containing protein [Nonomuraea sp. ZG12]|uniref:protein kinase domain-containing protein n=1 Tax=Nonomuraea sp. ZG12 TaxID=3452207 RepID=UPI003F8CACE4
MTRSMPGDPEELGGYWLAGRLGAGSRGIVYDSYDDQGRRFAVRVPCRDLAPIRRVAHRHLAEVVEVRLDGRVPYVVCAFADGPDLRQAVTRHGPYSGERLVTLAGNVAAALHALHSAGLTHHDLRPDKVLLTRDGPKVIGVGGPGAVGGTRTYLAPEVFTGQPAGAASDVFAWGGLVLYAATGEDPFRGGSLGEVMHRLLTVDPDVSMLPDALRELVAGALAKDPAARPTARELLVETALELPPPDGPAGPRPLGEVAEEIYATLSLPQRLELPGLLLALMNGPAPRDEHGTLARLTEAGLLVRRSVRVPPAEGELGTLVAVDGDGVVPVSAALYRAWPRLRAWVADERARAGRGRRWARLPAVAVLAASVAVAVSVSTVAVRSALDQGDVLSQANARVVAARAESLRTADPQAAMRLSVAAWKLAPVVEAREALQASLSQPELSVFTDPAASFQTSYRLIGDDLIRWAGGAVTHWDIPSRRLLAMYPTPSGTAALSADGRYAETADGRRVAISGGLPAAEATFTITNGDRTVLYAQDRPVFEVADAQVALSADGRRAAVSGPDGRVELWDVPGRAVSRTVQVTPRTDGDAPPLTFSPDGRLLAVAGARPALIGVSGTETGTEIGTGTRALPGWDFGPLGAPAFSPDSRLLAIPSGDGVRLWRADDRRLLATLVPQTPGHDYVFSGDGRTLHYLTGHGSVVSLDVSATVAPPGGPVDPALAVREVCARAGGALSEDEWRRLIPEAGYREMC